MTGSVEVTENGSEDDLYFDPIPSDFLQTPTNVNAAVLEVNGVNAVCDGDINPNNGKCAFQFSDALTPIVESISVSSSVTDLQEGDVIQITGNGFIAGKTQVTLGNVQCLIQTAEFTSASFSCVLQPGAAAGIYVLEISVAGRGVARVQSGVSATLTVRSHVNDISPLLSGILGGTVLSVSGSGLSVDSVVTIDGEVCNTISVSSNSILCTVPAFNALSIGTNLGDYAAVVQIASIGYTHAQPFIYSWTLTPQITDIFPRILSSAKSTLVTFTGEFSKLKTSACSASIFFASHRCSQVQQINDTHVTCLLTRGMVLPASQQTSVLPKVSFCTSESADDEIGVFVDPALTVDLALRVESISQPSGSIAGGSRLTVSGYGFLKSSQVKIEFIDTVIGSTVANCEIESSSFNSIVCVTKPFSLISSTTQTKLIVTVNDVEASCVTSSPSSCGFVFDKQITPAIKGLSNQNPNVNDIVVITGSGFSLPLAAMFGKYECSQLTFASSSSISCTIPPSTAGLYPVFVNTQASGLSYVDKSYALISSSYINNSMLPSNPVAYIQRTLRLTSITPMTGWSYGGTIVTIVGQGFPDESDKLSSVEVYFGLSRAVIINVSNSAIVCYSPTSSQPSLNTTTTIRVVVKNPSSAHATQFSVSSSDFADPSMRNFSSIVFYGATYLNINSLSPTRGFKGTMLRISCTSLGTDPKAISILIGGSPCLVIDGSLVQGSIINCTVTDTPAGVHPIYITVAGRGTARTSLSYTSLLAVNSISPSFGSFAGGERVVIKGAGFASDSTVNSIKNIVSFGINETCTLVSQSYDTIVCLTPPVNTMESLTHFQHTQVKRIAPFYTNGTYGHWNVNDNKSETFYYSDVANCSLSFTFGVNKEVSLDRLRFFPQIRYAPRVIGGFFEASSDGVNYFRIADIRSAGEGWNDLILRDLKLVVRAIRYRGPALSMCRMAEIEFFGDLLVRRIVNTQSAFNVIVQIPTVYPHFSLGIPSIPPTSFAITNVTQHVFTYTTSATPFINSISPRQGTALGGTMVSLSGSNLPISTIDLEVLINGIPCSVVSSSASKIECITGFRDRIQSKSIIVRRRATGLGDVLVASNVIYSFLDKWSALTTWKNDEPPIEGDTVVIPNDQSVLLDVSPPRLFLLLVQGTLVFDRQDLSMNASYIFVNGGKMQIGTEEEPFLNKVVITLHGDRVADVEIPHVGSKVLAVSNRMYTDEQDQSTNLIDEIDAGVLDIHGRVRQRVWTFLAQSSMAGSNTIVTREPVDYEAGDRIFVTSSSHNFEQAEEVTVMTLSADGHLITVDKVFEFNHTVETFTYGGESVYVGCEVRHLF